MTQKIEVDLGEIRQIASWLAASDVTFIEVRGPGTMMRLKVEERGEGDDVPSSSRSSASVSVAASAERAGAAQPMTPKTVTVTAKSAGVFLASHPAHSTPLVVPGSRVAQGDTVGLLQISHLCLPVLASHAGVVMQSLAAHGSTVGYGTPLFDISPVL
ncbi:acetyl-CoA carboxylase biotin carboxyl carrier protein [Trinickia soli]|uniref:acetyl-CoA carboxylase biotin carboxyl carrier protein n=1 Tax=Trinickia soli TaxID=380675 RepID=UPI0012510FBA|nr:acetyl-CoA carboxylase [Paraburkholderia sp. T12-10]